jgi:hypothetical protein
VVFVRLFLRNLLVHFPEGVDEEVGDVGEDGGAAGRDFVGGDELEEFREGVIDARRGDEGVLRIADKASDEVGGLRCFSLAAWRAQKGSGFLASWRQRRPEGV